MKARYKDIRLPTERTSQNKQGRKKGERKL